MTKEETSTAIAVMQAFCEGKTIEALLDGKWREIKNPSWNWDECTYRVKPGPREFWLVPDGEDYRAFECPQVMNGMSFPSQIHVREIE